MASTLEILKKISKKVFLAQKIHFFGAKILKLHFGNYIRNFEKKSKKVFLAQKQLLIISKNIKHRKLKKNWLAARD